MMLKILIFYIFLLFNCTNIFASQLIDDFFSIGDFLANEISSDESMDDEPSLPQNSLKGSVISLNNLGNTCYINALTVLIATTKLKKYLIRLLR